MADLTRHTRTTGILSVFILYALYMWLWVNPSLYLIRGYREFFTDTYFLGEFMCFPGSPAEYLSRFVIQLYNYPLIASLVIAVILLITYFLVLHVFKGKKFRYWIAFIPVAVLMLMHNDYRHNIKFDLDIFAVFLILNVLLISFRYNKRLPVISFPIFLAVLLYLNGILAATLFIVLTLILMILEKQKAMRFVEIIAGTVVVFLVFHYAFYLSLHDLHQEYVDISRIYSSLYFPLILYLSVLVVPFAVYFSRSFKGIKLNPAYTYLAAVLMLFGLLILTLNIDDKRGLSVQHYALNGNWEKALDYAAKCEYPDKDVVHYTNEALFFTGKIYNDLFLYNQSLGSEGLLITEIKNYSGIVPNQDVFLHLGAISLSIIWGTEATNVYGANPYVLKNLVKAYLSGGYIIEADKILNQLNRIPFNKKWVTRYRAFVNDTTLINKDSELNTYKQSQAPLAVVSTQSTLMNLFLLMKDSRHNRMAYDYLLIASLLDHKMDYFASYLTGLKEYGYTSIPKIYFEGLVYNSLYSPQSPVNIREFTFDPNIMYRFDAFRQDLRMALKDPESAPKMLENEYKDTYWYYILFQSALPNEEKVSILNRMTL